MDPLGEQDAAKRLASRDRLDARWPSWTGDFSSRPDTSGPAGWRGRLA